LLPRGRDALLPDAELPLAGRPCIDWSERVPHVAGPLGIAVCRALLSTRWLAPTREGRALRITTRGREAFEKLRVRL
jgi:hypothetical protein